MCNDGERAPDPIVVATKYGNVEYAEYGQGPAVIALHGAMGGYDQSLLLARTIGAAGFRYIAVSRPGYLGTPLSSGKSPDQQADLCAALLDTLEIPSATIMAVSGGGPCALHFALRYRDRCQCMVLVSTCGDKVEQHIPLSFKFAQLLVRWPVAERTLTKKALANMDAAIERSIPSPAVRASVMQDPEIAPLFMELMVSTWTRPSQRMPGTENDIAITRTTTYPLEDVAVPTLVVHGVKDQMLPFERHGAALASRIPGAALLAVEGGGHVAMFTHRAIVKDRVAQFMHHYASSDQAAQRA